MITVAVSQCSQCGAVVNVHWPTCPVCRAAFACRDSERSTPSGASHASSPLDKVIVESALRPDGTSLRPVYWERQGRIIGPGQPEFFFRDSFGQVGLIVRYEGELVSIADSMLRSHKAFNQQRPLKEVELVREMTPINKGKRTKRDFTMKLND